MASPVMTPLRRALLYVPASSQKMLTKSLILTSDNITYDLEDSVTPAEKPNARNALAAHLRTLSHGHGHGHGDGDLPSTRGTGTEPSRKIGEIAARINAVSTPYALQDLRAIGSIPSLEAVVIPKVTSASDLRFVAEVLEDVRPRGAAAAPVKLIALIESARAIVDLPSICAAGGGGGGGGKNKKFPLSGLIFAAEDFALDLSLTRTPSLREFLYARSAIVTNARAFGVPSVMDLVCTSYRSKNSGGDGIGDATGNGTIKVLEQECLDGKQLGFNGKQCIHPSQLETVQRVFSPSEEQVDWAVRIVIANDKAQQSGRGAWTMDGKMIDAPVVGKAKSLLGLAERCGIDVGLVRERWKGEEPG